MSKEYLMIYCQSAMDIIWNGVSGMCGTGKNLVTFYLNNKYEFGKYL